jgi:hypothetical protein
MDKSHPWLAALLVLWLPVTPVAAQQIIDATVPLKILEVAKEFGPASLDIDGAGDPMIQAEVEDGFKYLIMFYGCKEGEDCDDIQFGACFTDADVSLQDINDWNAGRKTPRAYLDSEGDACMDMWANIDFGVTRENLRDWFNWWTRVGGTFIEYLADGGDESASAPSGLVEKPARRESI